MFIDNKYFASGPPDTIFWNSARVSNGPHRITVAAAQPALSPDALFLASQSQDTTNFFVHNPAAWPSGVPTPASIPTLTPPVSPITVGPGTNRVVGNAVQNSSTGVVTGTDDTAAFQTLINSHNIIVKAGNYKIAGSLNFSALSNRVMTCQPGATFYASNSSGQRLVDFGWFGGSPNHISIGPNCTFAGTNVPAGADNYANYVNGSSQLLVIAGNGFSAASYINIQGNTFKNAQQDMIETYDNCGTLSTSNCNGITPGTDGEGPNHIYIANNYFTRSGYGGAIHVNGGHHIYVYNNTALDASINLEENGRQLQIMRGVYLYKNSVTSDRWGQPCGSTNSGPFCAGLLSCSGDYLMPQTGNGCWAVQNTVSGCATTNKPSGYNTCVNLSMGTPNGENVPYSNGYTTGNYYGNIATNGAMISGNCDGGCFGSSGNPQNQVNVPYCNGGTCSTTGWLNTPPTPN